MPTRKPKGITSGNIAPIKREGQNGDITIRKTSGALYELSNGYWGNLSPNQITALELGAQVTGYTKGFKKTGNLLYDMFLENADSSELNWTDKIDIEEMKLTPLTD